MADSERLLQILENIKTEFRVGSRDKAFAYLCDMTALILSQPKPVFKPQFSGKYGEVLDAAFYAAESSGELTDAIAKAREQPTPAPKYDETNPATPSYKKHPQERAPAKPTKQQLDHRCKEYPEGCRQCSPLQQDMCGVESEWRTQP